MTVHDSFRRLTSQARDDCSDGFALGFVLGFALLSVVDAPGSRRKTARLRQPRETPYEVCRSNNRTRSATEAALTFRMSRARRSSTARMLSPS